MDGYKMTVITYTRNTPDYTADKEHSDRLANQIEMWWHNKGHTTVKVWTEAVPIYGNHGDRIATRYQIRSNIYMNAKNA